ncbi:MAG: hypothetical protein U0992_22595 [Planctomycetaceae bacterium]
MERALRQIADDRNMPEPGSVTPALNETATPREQRRTPIMVDETELTNQMLLERTKWQSQLAERRAEIEDLETELAALRRQHQQLLETKVMEVRSQRDASGPPKTISRW